MTIAQLIRLTLTCHCATANTINNEKSEQNPSQVLRLAWNLERVPVVFDME